jgi:hypothetical protein
MDIFQIASRKKYRFQTQSGLLSVEDLWDLPLTSQTRSNLDSLAVELHDALEKSPRKSFVTPSLAQNADAQIKFDIVKHIIDQKMAERDQAATEAKRRRDKDQLMEILVRKENQQLESLTPEEIRAKIAAL